jgi:hypothetical protein
MTVPPFTGNEDHTEAWQLRGESRAILTETCRVTAPAQGTVRSYFHPQVACYLI